MLKRMKKQGHPHTPYIHVSVSDTLSTYGRLFCVWRFSIKMIECSLRLQHSPNVYRTYPRGEITHTQTKEEEEE